MLTGFEKYNEEMEKFENSALFKRCFTQIIYFLGNLAPGAYAKSKEIEDRYGLSGSEVRKIINHARKKSLPIISTAKGYGIARTFEEIQDTIAHLEERGREILFVASRLKKTFPNQSQLQLSGVA